MKEYGFHIIAFVCIVSLFVTACDKTIHQYPESEKTWVMVELNADRTPPVYYKELTYDAEGESSINDLEPVLSGNYTADERLCLRFVVELYKMPGATDDVNKGNLVERREISVERLTDAPQDTLYFCLADGIYKVLAWADYVPKEEPADWHFSTDKLDAVRANVSHKPLDNHHKNSAAGNCDFIVDSSRDDKAGPVRLSGNELKQFRNEVQAISDTFGKDFRETLNTANALTRQFGISTDEAVSLLKEGLISGADVSGEFLQNVREYSTFFKEAGLNADEFIAIVSQTNKDGLFSDKGIDAIKEATIRLREMTTATSTALENIGLDSKQVQKDLVSGSKTIFDVIREISARLGELPENSAAVGAAIADIFGSPGEDAGLQYLKTLKDIDTSMQTVMKSSGELGELQRARIDSEIELQNAISEFADITGGTFEALQSKIKTGWNATMTDIVKTINSQIKRVKGMFDFVGGLIDGLKGEPTFTIQEPKEEVLNDTDPNRLTPSQQAALNSQNKWKKKQQENLNRQEREENEKRMKMLQERQKKEIAALRALRDAENSLIEDSAEKQRATINASYDDQIEDLKRYLETEGNLTPKAKAAVNETIDRLNKKRTADLAKVNEKEMRNQLQQEADYIRQKLELSTEGDYQEYDLKAKLLKKEMEIELSNTELTTEQKKLIEERYQKKLDEMTSEHEREKQEKAMKAFELELSNRLAEAKIAGEDELQVELENAKKRLDSLQQLEGESDAEFKARQLEAQQEYLDAKEELAQREIEIEQAKLDAASQITGALSGLFEQLGESNKAFLILSKTLALAEIAIETGKAIAKLTSANAWKGIAGIAESAAGIVQIISNMTTAIGIINSSKFAKGGLVEGPGTGTSDSIPAMLSNGESVITARATSMFSPILSYINQAGGGAPIVVEKGSQAMGEDMIARAVAKGIKGIQPVVSVTEINKVGSLVNVVENLGDR